jgi:hypothetical protein
MTTTMIITVRMTVTWYKENRLSKMLVRFETIQYLALRKSLTFSVTVYRCAHFEVIQELQTDNPIISILKSV